MTWMLKEYKTYRVGVPPGKQTGNDDEDIVEIGPSKKLHGCVSIVIFNDMGEPQDEVHIPRNACRGVAAALLQSYLDYGIEATPDETMS